MKKFALRIASTVTLLSMCATYVQAALVNKNDYLNVSLPNAESKAEDIFSVDGKDLVLLDKKNVDGKDAYLVIENDIQPGRYYNGAGAWDCLMQKFDVEDTTGIGYWLNNTTDGYVTTMPVQGDKNMADYLLLNDWETEPYINRYTGEPDGWGNAYTTPYTVTAKIVIPSVTELRDYNDKIGYKTGDWWTRTAFMAWADGKCMTLVNADGTLGAMSGEAHGIRPMYWLSEDFFTSMKISLSDIGENVLSVIRSDFTEDELSTVYSASEIDIILGRETTEPEPEETNLVNKNDYLTVSLPNAESKAEDIFSVDGKDLVLLDKKEVDGKDTYLVIENDIPTRRYYNGAGAWDCLIQKFDVEDTTGIGYWLNNTTDGYITTMPVQGDKNMADYLILNDWKTEPYINRYTGEPDGWGNAYTTPYTVTAKIVIPSVTELRDYNDKIGYKTGDWWTRTAFMAWADGTNVTLVNTDGTLINMSGEAHGIRPMYWLSEDFFTSMKISLADIGENVLSVLRSDFTEDELSAVYSASEIDIIMGREVIVKPVAVNPVISGSGETTTEMTATAEGDENTESFEVVWEMSETSAESGFTKVGEGTSITVTNAIASANAVYSNNFLNTDVSITRWVRAAVTPVSAEGIKGDTVYTEAKQMPASLGPVAAETITIPYIQDSAEVDGFKVGDKKFTLLNAENGEFFVIADDYYGDVRSFDDDNTQKYDPEDTNNIGYYVNNTVMGNTDGSLPATVKSHTVSKVWRTEAGAANGNAPQDYAFTAKATLLSMSEWLKYQDKIGANCGGNRWVLRTTDGRWCGDYAATTRLITIGGESTAEGNVAFGIWDSVHAGYVVRPVMYLDREFFLDAKIPAENLGVNVREAMKSEYTLEELSSVYSKKELESYFGIYLYSVKNANLTTDTTSEKTASFDIVSNSASDVTAIAVVAVYDEDFKNLKGVSVKSITVPAGQTVSESISVSIPNGAETDKVKLMAIDGWTNIAPLCGAVILK